MKLGYEKPIKWIIRANEEGDMETKLFDKGGNVLKSHYLSSKSPIISSIFLRNESRKILKFDRWDERNASINNIEGLLENPDFGESNLKTALKNIVFYFKSNQIFEQPIRVPWNLQVAEIVPNYHLLKCIPTTSEDSLLACVSWLTQKLQPRSVLEVGCWLGHMSACIASVASMQEFSTTTIYCLDEFLWQTWMQSYSSVKINVGDSFMDLFNQNVKEFKNMVPLQWTSLQPIPNELISIEYFEMVIIDFSRDCNELNSLWTHITPKLCYNKSIIIINGIVDSTLPFLNAISINLYPIMKPMGSHAKVFLYIKNPEQVVSPNFLKEFDHSKVCFQQSPNWNHHLYNAFDAATDYLKARLHKEDSNVMFIPAIEEFFCNSQLNITSKWIGVIHHVPEQSEFYYAPDLRILLSDLYLEKLKHCIGLFTLTSLQADYLNSNWPKELPPIPITKLKYPAIMPNVTISKTSIVLSKLMRGEKIELVAIGNFCRDNNFFFRSIVPDNFYKVLLVGDPTSHMNLPTSNNVEIRQRLSDEEYEVLLLNSVVFLALSKDGAANTITLECIIRNIPILAPCFSSCQDYLGKDYPLYYDPQIDIDFGSLLNYSKLLEAITYLENLDKSQYSLESFYKSVVQSAVWLNLPSVYEF